MTPFMTPTYSESPKSVKIAIIAKPPRGSIAIDLEETNPQTKNVGIERTAILEKYAAFSCIEDISQSRKGKNNVNHH